MDECITGDIILIIHFSFFRRRHEVTCSFCWKVCNFFNIPNFLIFIVTLEDS